MGLLSYSKSGADPFLLRFIPSFYFWGSMCFGVYILIISVYVPFMRIRNHHLFNLQTTIALACIHSVLFLLLAWSYLRIRLTNPGNIPRPGHLTAKDLDALESGKACIPQKEDILSQEFYAVEPNGVPKYCHTCKIYRPLRTSHCHNTGRCVVKFDHYCPALGSAIGIRNYKYYINFLFYMGLTSIYLPLIDIFAISVGKKSELTIFLLVFSSLISVCIVTPLCVIHLKNLINNTTTRETPTMPEHGRFWRPWIPNILYLAVKVGSRVGESGQDKPLHFAVVFDGKFPYKKSIWENWTEVMGIYFWEWFLPIAPTLPEDGGKWWVQDFNDATKEKLRLLAKEGMTQMLEKARAADVSANSKDLTGSSREVDLARPQSAHLRHETPAD